MRCKYSQGPNASSCGQRRLGSDWADAPTDQSLRWAHSHFVGFSHEAAHLDFLFTQVMSMMCVLSVWMIMMKERNYDSFPALTVCMW